MTPSGSPAWTRTASHADYGGDVNKRNYMSQGSIDPTTDVSATEFARMVADLEAVVRTMPFATITFLNNDTTPAAPTIESVYMMTGVRATTYEGDEAPAGLPSAERDGDGNVIFTFESSYEDAYGVAGGFSISHVSIGVQSTTSVVATYEVLSATTVRVMCWDSATGAPQLDARITLGVW